MKGPRFNKCTASDTVVASTWVATGIARIVTLVVVFYASDSPAVVNSHNITASRMLLP